MVLKGKGLPTSVRTVTKVCLTFDVTVLATFTGAAGSASALGVVLGRAMVAGDVGVMGEGATVETGEAIGATGAGVAAAAAGLGVGTDAAGGEVGVTGDCCDASVEALSTSSYRD